MREALATAGQAPHTAVVGCSDSRVPLETVFDALPGDLFVLRNAGNTCTHAEGSVLGSLEFCTGALNTRLIFVLGHTNCGAIKGATKVFFESKKSRGAKDGHALESLLQGLSSVAESAAAELGRKATEEDIANHAVKLNVFRTMNFMIQHSEPIRQKVKSGDLEIHGGIYDLGSGRVQFLGQTAEHTKMISPKQRLLGA
ncbi:NCE103 [Symbiodinium natans]|uniref:Carbonic anhydrase n=1 Tax=Symbiodinium natans TaxID=878477 RepID=A0A812SR94_9DINO|nr:NCE103 [Symbiodinium natans]